MYLCAQGCVQIVLQAANYKPQITMTKVSVFPPSPQGLRRGKQCSPLQFRFRRDFRFAPTGFSFFVFSLTPETRHLKP